MSSAVAPLAENEHFTSILTMFSNPILGMLAGLVLTAVIQSSSASVGILQALCITGAVGYKTAIPIIMGQNIGTCVTALISSIGASKNAKRASMIHLYFNLIGTILFMVAFYSINAAIGGFDFLNDPANAAGIAVVHSLFNIGAVLVLYPFGDKLVKAKARKHRMNLQFWMSVSWKNRPLRWNCAATQRCVWRRRRGMLCILHLIM